MNLLEMICKKLGVEIDEEWTGNDGKFYSIDKNGKLTNYAYKEDGRKAYTDWVERVLSGELKPKWKPKDDEVYYTISFFDEDPAELLEWGDRGWERGLLKRGLVFETKEEAIEVANKMLEAIKED